MHTNVLTKWVLMAALTSTTLFANEESTTSSEKRIPVGSRSLSVEEWGKIQDSRKQEAIELEEKEDVSETTSEEGKPVAKAMSKATYFTSHMGSFHHPMSVSLLGDKVELEDGSIWNTSPSDRYKTLDWMTGDDIFIMPNHNWFSAYDYKLVNLNTGVHVAVNLNLGPFYNGLYTHWILAIDYYHREICLEDGSVWKMSSVDTEVINKWLPNDTVIIGINDGWFSGSNPNLLINVNLNMVGKPNFAIGNCIY